MGNKDAGNLGMQESVSPAQNEMYADFIVKYMGDFRKTWAMSQVLVFRK
ncbi:MAG: hypothetical protein ACLRMZ_26685 [Blautia marasmi]